MKIKKLLAGVAAAALTVTSLAVVNVSADDVTKTYNLVGEKGKVKFTYENSVNFRGGIAPYDGWVDEDGNEATDFLFTKTGEITFAYAGDNGTLRLYHGDMKVDAETIAAEAEINTKYFSKVKVGKGLYVEVTGVDAKGNTIVAKATAKISDAKDNETINILKKGDDKKILDSNDLDLIDMVIVKSMKLKEDFEFNIGDYKLNSSLGCEVCPGNGLQSAISAPEGWKLSCWWANVTGETYKTGGRNVTIGLPYGFGGVFDDDHTIVINGGNLDYKDFGYNTLRWINDNIEQNKGAVLRINFMTPAQSSALNAISGTGSDSYITDTDISKGEWDVPVLTPGHSSSTTVTEQDIAIAVNIKNTSKLQLTGNINTEDKNNMYVEFDWDKLVQNSAATIAGNVDSIHFRILDTANVRNNLKPTDANYVGIKSIEIIVPDQATIPGGNVTNETERQQLKSIDSNTGAGVRVVSTNAALNGGTIDFNYDISASGFFYNIKLIDDSGVSIQPKGDLTIELYIPKTLQGRTLKVTELDHVSADGTVSKDPILNLDTYKTDNFLKIKVNKLSSIGGTDLFEDEETQAPETQAPETQAPETQAPAETTAAAGNTNQPSNDKGAPATGFAIAIVPAAIAAAAAVVAKKRK